MTREQCRAARGLLGWKQPELARRAGIALKTLVDFERGQRETHRSNLDKVEAVLTKAGIEFVTDPERGDGIFVRRKKAKTRSGGHARKARTARASRAAP